MNLFHYDRANDPAGAVARVAADPRAAFLAGGTGLIDLMKLGVERPATLVDVSRLPLAEIVAGDASITLGALARNSDVAWHDAVRARLPVLSEAILSGASPQLRNMATIGGNLMQRTRCLYFRDGISPCNRRAPGAGCSAMDGFNRAHAVLGTSEHCIAAHPSDLCVALAALDAVVRVRGPAGERRIAFDDFYLAPGDDPSRETTLAHGELITAVEVPAAPWLKRSHYFKVRDRESYEFALASAAVAVELRDGAIVQARLALGGVATRPCRARAAEQTLIGAKPDAAAFRAAADAALLDARPRKHNAFKVELAKRTIVRALTRVLAPTHD